MSMPPRRRRRAHGFTLIEVAVVIAIIATLLGTLLVPLATQVEASRIKAQDRLLEEIREALLGFAMTQGRLPCPDVDRDGIEDRDAADADGDLDTDECTASVGVLDPPGQQGFLPGATLGVGQTDAWGRLHLYRVSTEFTYAAVPGAVAAADNNRLDLADSDQGDMIVHTRGDDPATAGFTETRSTIDLGFQVPVVVLSLGPNGTGGVTPAGNVIPEPDPVADEVRDERDNRTGASVRVVAGRTYRQFVSRSQTRDVGACDDSDEAAAFCAFDDRVVWLSANVIMNRLVTAGVLP